MHFNDVYYSILLFSVLEKAAQPATIERHIAFLKDLDEKGKLVLAGPFADFPGGMIIIRAESLDEAKRIAKSDPFIIEGVRTFEVRTWLLANRENGYLGEEM